MVHRIKPPVGIEGLGRSAPQAKPAAVNRDFAAVLAKKLGELKFSSHATARLQSRGIELGREKLERLHEAVELAAAKGARDALIVVDDVALVVSIRNRTVVTAMDRDQAKATVFTNIDSAVLT